MSSRVCPICGDSGTLAYEARIIPELIGDFTYASRKAPELMHYEYRACPNCDLLFTSSLPDRSSLLSAYEAAAFDASIESTFAAETYLGAIKRVLRSPITSVLDVGCGDGEFLLACRNSGISRIAGIEPSSAASGAADESIASVIVGGGYEEYVCEESFDLVTLFQTIEHIDDPMGFLQRAKSLARPGGYVAIACHDFQAPVNRLLKDKSPIFDIEHLQIFSKRAIEAAMTAAGLKVVSIRAYSNTYPISYWMRLSPVSEGIKNSSIVRKSFLGRLPMRAPIGNLMAIAQTQ